jgi:predicted histone-like DNA-binding protein
MIQNMAITITPIGKTSPTNPGLQMLYYPKVIKTGETDLDEISEKIAYESSLTQADCYAVIISLVHMVSQELDAGKIVRLGHLGCFQISVEGTGSTTPDEVSPKNVQSASIIFRPGKKFKEMLRNLKFVRK